ncbi:MAG: hypothetical protein Q7N50_09710 [Armatimonadota bacterium]|nr:hypothetical protein [Armatimonadota bacterium]
MRNKIRRCQVCGVREITTSVAIWQHGSEQSRTFVCTSCAVREEKLISQGGEVISLAEAVEIVAENQSRRAGADHERGCPVCGSTIGEIVADGLLGCGYCYTRFRGEVESSIKMTQGNLNHIGKSPFG